MAKTINTILNLTDKFTPKLTEAQRQVLVFKNQLKSCNEVSDKIDEGFEKAGKAAAAFGAAGVAAMTAFAASAVKTYGEFQKSMSNVAGILAIDQTSESYARLEEAAREAGKSTTKTAQEAADALSYMALAGWSVDDSIEGLMPILRASEATGADLATTSDLVTDSMSALGLQTSELSSYLDICAKAQNTSNTTLTQMQEAYIEVGGTFKTFNTSLEESGALLGILANRGIKGSEAGNSLQSTLVNLTKKSGESYSAMQQLGVSAYDSEGNFKGVTNVLKEVQQATADMTEEQRNSYLTMIAGKTQLTTLNALMSGLTNTLENGANEYDDLYYKLENCGGALENMAGTMTDNFSGALARAGSAVSDLQIALGKQLEPHITQVLNWFSEQLPGATEKLALWLDTNLPKAIDFCKGAFEKIKPVLSFIINNFREIISVAAGIVAGLKAFSIITKVVSFMDKLRKAESLLKVAQVALNTSMLACPITWIAAGIAAVAAGILLYKNACEKAKEEDIAKHFGDISLSAEECGKIVDNVFGQDLIDDVNDLNAAWDASESSISDLESAARNLNKLTFQIGLNPENVSQDDYTKAAQDYIDKMQEAIKDKQYEISLDISFLLGENGKEFLDSSSAYYQDMLKNAQNLGDELVQNIAQAYTNGWDDVSMDMVAKSLEKMNEIQSKIQTAQAKAQMELVTADFVMGDLSEESFTAYIEKLQEQGNAIAEAAKTASANAIASLKLQLEDGYLSQDDYNTQYEAIMKGYQTAAAEADNTVLTEAYRGLREVYSDEFAQTAEHLNNKISGTFAVNTNHMAENMEELQNVIESAFKDADISKGVKENIKTFMKALSPTTTELKNMASSNQALWKTYGETLTTTEAFESLSGTGKLFGNAVLSGVNSQGMLQSAETAGEAIKEAILKPFGEVSDVTLPLNVTLTGDSTNSGFSISAPSGTLTANGSANTNSLNEKGKTDNSVFGKISRVWNDLTGHATGTAYFGGGFTRINENGGEIIDLPTGSRIYPADKSAKMMNTPNININVNIDGNVIGNDEFAEEVGDIVCERIVDVVMAM